MVCSQSQSLSTLSRSGGDAARASGGNIARAADFYLRRRRCNGFDALLDYWLNPLQQPLGYQPKPLESSLSVASLCPLRHAQNMAGAGPAWLRSRTATLFPINARLA